MQEKSTAKVCVVCGGRVKRRERAARFCSRACAQVRWAEELAPKLSELGNSVIRSQMDAGAYCDRGDGGRFVPKSSTRQKTAVLDTAPEIDDGTTWRDRATYWEQARIRSSYTRRVWGGQNEATPAPLVLNGHGVRVHVDKGTLLITNGRTHHPQEPVQVRLFPGSQDLPPRILVLEADGSISFDALAWLARQSVPLVQLDWQGRVVNVVGVDEGWYDAPLRQAQHRSMTNGLGLEFATQLIRAKLEAARITLQGLWQSPARDSGLMGLEKALADIKAPPARYQDIRLIEARGAAVYFAGWQDQPIKWKGLSRRPIPPDWHRCGTRAGVRGTGSNRRAAHPTNAMLNYGYAVLESEVRIAILTAGLDPEIGYLHANRKGRLSLVYDLMEPMRPVVDMAVLAFVNEQTFAPNDFILSERGICRLHPQLARRIVETLPMVDDLARPVSELLAVLEPLASRTVGQS
jgi:CRISP-associated protein Cas1